MRKLKIQVLSDLHLELPLAPKRFRSEYDIKVLGNVLILAGDIGSPFKKSLEQYLEEISKKYELILYVPGNHEYYKGEYHHVLESLEKLCEKWDNIFFLNEKSLVRYGVRFVGCTLWTFVPEEKYDDISRMMSEYQKVSFKDPKNKEKKKRKLCVQDTVGFHQRQVAFIKSEVQDAKKNNESVIVITHHSPNLKSKSDGGDSDGSHESSIGYASNLREMFEPPIIAWISGHTHKSRRMLINGIPCVSNQLGYITFRQPTGFDPEYVLNLSVNEKKEEAEGEEEEN